MPRRIDLKKVAIIGSGPIVIGQACEFDYSGTQACKALMAEGLEVILINSNPATIMTDPEVASRVYVEPLRHTYVAEILRKERPDALIPTLGGQTALNLGLELFESGLLDELGIELLGAKPDVIRAAEDRERFRAILDSVGAKYPRSEMVRTFEEGLGLGEELGFPLILRPNYTLGGGGGGIAYSLEEYKTKLALALAESPTSEVLVEASILGWKEFELEVMRDGAGTFVVVCSIENLDPCGVHTGDSITVAPQQTLSDREYQDMRDEARKIIDAVGVETGGANIQFAVHPHTGERVVIEMNPRVSRSSALASKATGFPIAKIAALLAVGYRLDEIQNDITGSTPSCYEPALDYVVTKIPRFAFEKFLGVKDVLTTQMKSVGEVMGIGRTFKESLNKAVLSLEEDPRGFPEIGLDEAKISTPNSRRIFHLIQALRQGFSVSDLNQMTQITPWFLEQLADLVDFEKVLKESQNLSLDHLRQAKQWGFSDVAIAEITGRKEVEIREMRHRHGVRPAFLQVDTCAGEFASSTPYYYSTYQSAPAPFKAEKKRLVLMGSGPNRIGQGVEFDYSCVRSVREFQRQGYAVMMINSNPETVSTDYDTSDALFFEPLVEEHVAEVIDHVGAEGFVAQLGGQTPINLTEGLIQRGAKILGSSLESMNLAEDRSRFIAVCREFGFKLPATDVVYNLAEARQVAEKIGYPLICRPSFVLGGRKMEIVEDQTELDNYFERYGSEFGPSRPLQIDQFLDRALELDVDLIHGKDWCVIGGVLEHIEAAGVHSGDSMGVIPPQRLKHGTLAKIEDLCAQLAGRLGILGFLNLQLAVKNDEIYMLEANPRSSRSVPFLAKATGIPIVDLGVRAICGRERIEVKPEQYEWHKTKYISVKGVTFPFKKFPEADSILGPEMKSTGESMGRAHEYGEALLKAIISTHVSLPLAGEVFLSLRDKDKEDLLPLAKELQDMGYKLSATGGTARFLSDNGLTVELVKKVHEGRPNCVDRIRSRQVSLVINTTSGRQSVEASFGIRRSCVDYSIPCLTESDAARAFFLAVVKHRRGDISVAPLD